MTRTILKLNKPTPPKSKTQIRREAFAKIFAVMGEYEVWLKCYPLKIGIYEDIKALPEMVVY